MSQTGPLRQRLIDRFDEMSPQLKRAARHLIENPQEVALISMRELARNAGVQPATMTRLAKFVGASGYDELRNEQAEAIRRSKDGFVARAVHRRRQQLDEGPIDLAQEMLGSMSHQMARLSDPENLVRLVAAAEALQASSRIYVLGARSCLSVAWQFHYAMSLISEKSIHLQGLGGTDTDPMIRANADDALLVISIKPYARRSLETAQLARSRGMTVVAITDSEVSPFVSLSHHTIMCTADNRNLFHSLAPAMAISEILCGLIASANREDAIESLGRADAHLASIETYASETQGRQLR